MCVCARVCGVCVTLYVVRVLFRVSSCQCASSAPPFSPLAPLCVCVSPPLHHRISKAALNMAAKLASEDLKGRGIAVVAVHPGMVETDMKTQFFTLVVSAGPLSLIMRPLPCVYAARACVPLCVPHNVRECVIALCECVFARVIVQTPPADGASEAPAAAIPSTMTTTESAAAILTVVDKLSVETTGQFLSYDGTALPY